MGLYEKTAYFLMGDRGLLLEFGNEISIEVNEKVKQMDFAIRNERIDGIVETIPTYRSLLIIYNPLVISIDKMRERLSLIEARLKKLPFPKPKLMRIPVVYGGTYGPDLEGVARYHQITTDEVIRLHCSKPYLVYMIGFMPGFPYMGDLPERLATPRLKTPRLSVARGSVGIAQRQTGIYPMESPGGWLIIGRTPIKLFYPDKEPPALVQIGDLIQFYQINEKEFEEWDSNQTPYISPLGVQEKI